jgi:transglutaminase-like putative cysteine protease
LLLFVALVVPINDVNAVDQQNASNQTSNLTSNLSTSNSTSNTQNVTNANLTVNKVSTKAVPADPKITYTYYVKVSYKAHVKVAYYKSYRVKVKVLVKKRYYWNGKYRTKYYYSYKYVTKYKKYYKWVYKTKYKSVAKTGYKYSSEYLKSTKNCQVTDPTIVALANKLTNGTNSSYEKAVNIFNWVRDNLGYSFYYNTKYGAVKTLKAKVGNCVDHSHLLIALARAAGIPAQYAHGDCVFKSGNTYGHVWVQLYVNDKWYSADATSSSNTFGVINSWNTATATIHGFYPEISF